MKAQKRFRNIVFTFNNYNDNEYNNILNSDVFKYVIIGKEVGDSGTPHLQGYGEFIKQQYFSTIKNLFPKIHFEPRRGTQKQAIDYCKKDGDYVENGTQRIQGQRMDLIQMREAICNGASYRSILLSSEVSSSQLRVLDSYFTYLEPKKREKPKVYWYYGSTGTGKTKSAMEMSSSEETYIKDHTKWWDGIDNHETVILDDFRASQMKFSDLLRLLDWNPYRCEIKGGFRWLKCKNIIITTPRRPEDTYSNMSEDINQLLRRIDCLRDFDDRFNLSGLVILRPLNLSGIFTHYVICDY